MGTKDCCERNEPEADLREQGLCPGDVRPNGLGRLSGGWSEKEFRDFERATAQFEEVDEQP
jgi:hypothetical protein